MASAITNKEIEDLAKGIGINNKLDRLGLNLGCEFETIDAYKALNHSDAKVTYQGTRQMLRDWRDEIEQKERQRPILKKALEDAGLARLAEQYLGGKAAMGTGQAGRSETKTISDAPSGSRLRKGQKPVKVYQKGDAKTINASGRSQVKGNSMSESMTTVNIHNHACEKWLFVSIIIILVVVVIWIYNYGYVVGTGRRK